MTPRVKQALKEYLTAVNLETIRKDLRIPLIKESIRVLTIVEDSGLWEKMRCVFPNVGTLKPIDLRKDKTKEDLI
jgi:hypothetical protein